MLGQKILLEADLPLLLTLPTPSLKNSPLVMRILSLLGLTCLLFLTLLLRV